jgi:hypothetical protein
VFWHTDALFDTALRVFPASYPRRIASNWWSVIFLSVAGDNVPRLYFRPHALQWCLWSRVRDSCPYLIVAELPQTWARPQRSHRLSHVADMPSSLFRCSAGCLPSATTMHPSTCWPCLSCSPSLKPALGTSLFGSALWRSRRVESGVAAGPGCCTRSLPPDADGHRCL